MAWTAWMLLNFSCTGMCHYCDVIMGAVAFQITRLTTVYSTVYSDADQRKHHSSASLAFVRGIHRGQVNSPHKWPVTRKIFPFNDVIMPNVWYSIEPVLLCTPFVVPNNAIAQKISTRYCHGCAFYCLGYISHSKQTDLPIFTWVVSFHFHLGVIYDSIMSMK